MSCWAVWAIKCVSGCPPSATPFQNFPDLSRTTSPTSPPTSYNTHLIWVRATSGCPVSIHSPSLGIGMKMHMVTIGMVSFVLGASWSCMLFVMCSGVAGVALVPHLAVVADDNCFRSTTVQNTTHPQKTLRSPLSESLLSHDHGDDMQAPRSSHLDDGMVVNGPTGTSAVNVRHRAAKKHA